MISKMTTILVNDIFDELSNENIELKSELLFANKCYVILDKFRYNLNLIFNKFKKQLNSENIQIIEDLEKEYKKFCEEKEIKLTKSQVIVDKIDGKKLSQTLSEDQNNTKSESNVFNNNNNNRNNENLIIKQVFKQLNQSKPQITAKEYYKCNYFGCNETYYSSNGLYKHKILVHRLEVTKNKNIRYKRCDQMGCDYKTNSKRALIDHKNVHTGLKPYKCSHIGCDKAFSSHKSRNKHEKCYHLSEKPISCEFLNCDKMFKSKEHMRKHFKVHFDREKRFVCDFPKCEFKARFKSMIEIHKTTHNNEKPFVCTFDKCDKRFKTKGNLKVHTLTHNCDNNSILIKCPFNGCVKTYRNPSSLRKHQLVHKNKFITCDWPGCEFKTIGLSCLKRHKIAVHSSEANYVCDWPECGKRFKLRLRLEIHQRIHRNDKRYVCHWPGCHYRCVDSGNFRKHIKIHEKKLILNNV